MSADVMPCGCQGHADNAQLCRYPALLAEVRRLRAALERIQAIGEDVYDAITPPHEIAREALAGGGE